MSHHPERVPWPIVAAGLTAATGRRWCKQEDIAGPEPAAEWVLTRQWLADIVGTHKRTIANWVNLGVPADRLDTIACHVGYHPAELWPDWCYSDDELSDHDDWLEAWAAAP